MTDVQQSLFDEEAKIEQAERDSRMHKAAFRVAFDFLQAHWPVQHTEEYWLKFCEDIKFVSGVNSTNELCQELLTAITMYLCGKDKNDG